MTPAITVAIPAYNAERSISRALDSAAAQTFKDFEMLVVDDGSQDATKSVVEQCAARDGRVVLASHEANQGVSAARKTCVENARGKYIFWLDADDWIEPDALERLLSLAEGGGADMVFFGKLIEEKDGSIRRMYLPCRDKKRAVLYLIRRLCVMNPMVKTDVARKAAFPPLRFAEDVALAVQCAVHSEDGGVVSLPRFLYHYAYNPLSICHEPRNAAKNAEDLIKAFDWVIAFLTERGRPDWAKTAEEEKALALKYRRLIRRGLI
jgi:glycosyltransferase involved in cell wall biosynthesis